MQGYKKLFVVGLALVVMVATASVATAGWTHGAAAAPRPPAGSR